MQKIIHVTDTHLCPPGQRVVGFDPAERLRTVVRSIYQNHDDAVLCVISGDLTDTGGDAEYEALRNCLAELTTPYRLLLGNHDKRQSFRRVFAEEPVDADGFVQSTLDLADWSLLFLDTLDEAHPGRGLLGRRRLAWLDAQLASRSDRPVLIFMHHPPASIGVPSFDDILLADGPACLDRIAAHPRHVHVAFGHVHMKVSGCFGRVPYSSNRGTCHKIAPRFQEAPVDYVDAAPAYDTLLLDRDGVVVHAMDPAGPNVLVAHEYATEDGRGRIELNANPAAIQWI